MSVEHDEGDLRFAFDDGVRPLVTGGKKVPVVLWLEEDRPAAPPEASALGQAIKKELVWLNPHVIVASRVLAQTAPLAGLTVTSLSRGK